MSLLTFFHRLPRKPAGGAEPVGAVTSMAIVLVIVGVALTLIYRESEHRQYETVADQATHYANAAKLYIAANYDDLLNEAPTTISYDTLVDSGYLNEGTSETNLFQQTWNVAVKKSDNDDDVLEGVVVSSGGTELDYAALRYISASIDGSGGFVYSGSNMPDGCTSSTTTVNGAFCAWTLDISDFGVTTTSGHIAVNLSADLLGTENAGADFLHRYSTTGHEEYNQMETAIDMNDNNINNAGNVLVESDGNDSDDHATSGSMGYLGWSASGSDGTTADGTNLTAGFYYSDNNDDEAENVWIKTTDDASLDVSGKLKASTVKGSTLINSEQYTMPGMEVTAGDACDADTLELSDQLDDTTGLIAHDSNGATLTCQSGVWVYDHIRASTNQDDVDAVCTATDSLPKDYDWSQYVIVCGSRYCRDKGFRAGIISELAETTSGIQYGAGYDLTYECWGRYAD